ncbi:ABC transporter ATP-binding protein [Roseibium denhamense]|uniref:Amino acid/amide ABC transporter ATP-binding protein 1, HAAT family n=1 Tax=Roseibium denhamense TaxID=76305 RepID=A0ABY1NH73_9HYPH|nr:ABC transporter ATP-binding protein [Roseibium denhamense]MTI05021.1 ABC transporter ATP-binding protein [Roseibium denhamense]SMP09645.1 amino acid/amide ABC transporter ATP-binding protein 1, HAAT family [Roseibium denhamense]
MANAVLETRNLTKSFGALQVSKSISIDLLPGEIHAVIGPNGAGKTTLIHQICGGLRPDGGTIRFDGQDVTGLSVDARAAAGLARTFQISALAQENTVLENAVLGAAGAKGQGFRMFTPALERADLVDAARSALERVGLLDQQSRLVSELSHGQRRQLEVALALSLSPKAFILDEPMAGLGTEGSKRMTAFLNDLRLEAPILLVEHDMDAVFALADRISVLVYGEIIASGTVDEVRANPKVQEAYLGEAA